MAELYVINRDNTVAAILPDAQKTELTQIASDVGLATITYPVNGIGASLLLPRAEIAVIDYLSNQRQEVGRYILEESTKQTLRDADSGEGSIDRSGRDLLSLCEHALAYPPGYPNATDSVLRFAGANAGGIVLNVFNAAVARNNVVQRLTPTFTNAVDSNGVAWTHLINISFDAGTNTLLSIIQSLVDTGLCEVKVIGRNLNLYDSPALTNNISIRKDLPPNEVALMRGRDLLDAPLAESTKDLTNVTLVGADNNTYLEVVDADGMARWANERYEGFTSHSGATDQATLQFLGAANNFSKSSIRAQWTHGLQLADKGPMPLVDYSCGDFILSDVAREQSGWISSGWVGQPLRVMQLVLTYDQNNIKSGSVTLGTIIDVSDVAIQKWVTNIANGNSTSSTAVASRRDTVAPGPPTNLLTNTAAYVTPSGAPAAQIDVSWSPPTTNVDGTALADLSYYHVWWTYSGYYPMGKVQVDGTTASFSPVRIATPVTIYVTAVDQDGNESAPAYTGFTTASDTTGPNVPSTPTINDQLFFGVIQVTWDGKDSSGASQPPDFRRCEVHASIVSQFTPDSTTWRDSWDTPTGGITTISGATGVPLYVRLIAVDSSGNRSGVSAQGTGTPRQAVSADIGAQTIAAVNMAPNSIATASIIDAAIITAKIANLAVGTAQINDLAVNDAKIGSLSVTKIVAGSLVADITISSRIKTADTGARSEMNSTGFHTFLADGTEAFSATTSGVNVVGTLTAKGTLNSAIQATVISGVPIIMFAPQNWTQDWHRSGVAQISSSYNFGSGPVPYSTLYLYGGRPNSNSTLPIQYFDSVGSAIYQRLLNGANTTQIYNELRLDRNQVSTMLDIRASGAIYSTKLITSGVISADGLYGNTGIFPAGTDLWINTNVALRSQFSPPFFYTMYASNFVVQSIKSSKTDITEVTNASVKLAKFKPVYYKRLNSTLLSAGFVAEDVEKVAIEAASYETAYDIEPPLAPVVNADFTVRDKGNSDHPLNKQHAKDIANWQRKAKLIPGELVGINTMSLLTLNIAATQELITRIEALEGKASK